MNLKLLPAVMLGFALSLAGCKNEAESDYKDVDGLPPTITMSDTEFRAEPGRTFTLEGKVEDNDGIRSIHLYCPDIYLDKTIEFSLDPLVVSYDLAYQFKTFTDVPTTSAFSVSITATDHGGRSSKETVNFTMDGDFDAPSFKTKPDSKISLVYVSNTPEPTLSYNLQFSVEDNIAMEYVEVSIPHADIDFYEKVETFTGGKSLTYARAIDFPTQRAEYTLTIKAVDKQDNETTVTSIISVTDEIPDYAKIYLADVATAAELNSDVYGVPMMVERTGPWTYVARYYNKQAGTQIRFIPQKTDFAPMCFGVDPDDSSKLGDDPQTLLPLILNEVGYYRIELNIHALTYSVEMYIPTDDPLPIGTMVTNEKEDSDVKQYEFKIGLAGKTFPGMPEWSTKEPLFLTQDATNPYLFSAETNLVAGNTMEYTITLWHPDGWWPNPFWRFDAETGEEANVANGGSNMAKIPVPATGKYRIEFDTHLLRSKLYRIE